MKAEVNLDCNVLVRSIDRKGRVIRESYKHNKATVTLVDGILRFLKGDFNPTTYNRNVTNDEGHVYIPVKAQFGNIGVVLKDGKFDYIDKGQFVRPIFTTSSLQKALSYEGIFSTKFNKIRQAGYTDNNNSECLEFTLYLSPGLLVGREVEDSEGNKKFEPYSHSYYNSETHEYETIITEIGLLSDTDNLLARVLYDGDVTNVNGVPVYVDKDSRDNPIIQSESTTLVLIWRIGIVSVDRDYTLVTENNIDSQELANWIVNSLLPDSDISTTSVDQEGRTHYDIVVNDTLETKVFNKLVEYRKEEL